MGSKRSWTVQQQNYLKMLREQQGNSHCVSWQSIADDLHKKFPKSLRNSKQCRQKYVNYLKIQQESLQWSQTELDMLYSLYQKYGSSWNLISTFITSRAEGSIKNKFNTFLRKASKTLHLNEYKIKEKKTISFQMLSSMLNYSNKLKKMVQELKLTTNPGSLTFKFRSQVLRLCFKQGQFDQQQLIILIKIIKSLNSKIRCFGIFKVKNSKLWDISYKALINICQFDNLITEDIQNLKTKIQQKIVQKLHQKQREQQKKRQRQKNRQKLHQRDNELTKQRKKSKKKLKIEKSQRQKEMENRQNKKEQKQIIKNQELSDIKENKMRQMEQNVKIQQIEVNREVMEYKTYMGDNQMQQYIKRQEEDKTKKQETIFNFNIDNQYNKIMCKNEQLQFKSIYLMYHPPFWPPF